MKSWLILVACVTCCHEFVKDNLRLLNTYNQYCMTKWRWAAQTCTNNLRWPSEATTGFSGYNSVDSFSENGYLMEAAEYHTPDDCTCGVIYKWVFVPQAAGAIQFQVWDHSSQNSNYQLKGENYFTVTANAVGEQIEFLIPERDRITVRNNYLLGWYGPTSGIIGYKEGTESYSDEAIRRPMFDLDPSHEPLFDWRSVESVLHPDRIYAVGAEVYSNTAPEFTNLPREVWIYRDETAGAYLYQISANDIDQKDVSTLLIYDIAEDSTNNFYYDRTTQKIYLAVSNPDVGTYTMTFTVQDQCFNANNGILTIQVLNWAPSLTNLPSFATLPEVTTNEVVLFTINFSDKDNSTLDDSYTLNVDPAAASNIESKYVGQDKTDRSIVSKKGASYSYSTTQQYIMDLTLSDGTEDTDKGYFILSITKNDPPMFTNLNNGAQCTMSYVTSVVGDTIYTVSVTDAENDELTYTMSCEPAGCPLHINNNDGVISVSSSYDRSTVGTGWDIAITVTDGYTVVGPKSLSVLVKDINDTPQFVNLPLADAIAVHEGTALGSSLFTVSFMDSDTADTHTIQATYDPTWAANFFDLNNTSGSLATAHNILDYEQHDSDWTVVVTIAVYDGKDSATSTLSINIRNVNERPSFHQTKYTLETPEEGTNGLSAGDWQPRIFDPDLDIATPTDTHAYTWDCGIYTRYFRMARSDGAVTFATQFDYDKVTFTAPYDCVVTVTDKAGLTATTTLEIDIHDINDNGPVFAQTTDYYIFQTPSLDPGRLVGQVTANDLDKSAENNAIYYSFKTSPFSKDFLLINDFGNIYVNETWTTPQFEYGLKYELVVQAENVKDTTGAVLSATTTVTLLLSGTTTTQAITTDRPFEFIEDTRNVAWLAVALTLGGALLIIVCGFLMMYTVQVKRYRWCIPWCRKRLLGLTKMTRKEKKRYYRGLLMQEEMDKMSSDSDDGFVRTIQPLGNGGSEGDTEAPPMMWNTLKDRDIDVVRGKTVRKTTKVPRAAVYDEPQPPLKKDISKMMKTKSNQFWT